MTNLEVKDRVWVVGLEVVDWMRGASAVVVGVDHRLGSGKLSASCPLENGRLNGSLQVGCAPPT